MFIKRKTDKFVIVLLAAGLFCFLSYRPRQRQVPAADLPREQGHALVPGRRSGELAGGEGGEVVRRQQPGRDVLAVEGGVGAVVRDTAVIAGDRLETASDVSARTRYWQRLAQVWNLPTIWTKQYEWDTGWTTAWTDDIKSVGSWFYSRLPR